MARSHQSVALQRTSNRQWVLKPQDLAVALKLAVLADGDWLPYAYPPVRGEITIGFATAHAVPPLKDQVLFSGESPPVWPHPEGDVRGPALLPLYPTLPLAARATHPGLTGVLRVTHSFRTSVDFDQA